MYMRTFIKQDLLNPEAPAPGGADAPPPAPPAEPAAAPPAEPAPAAAPPASNNWDSLKASIAEDLRGDASLEPITSLDGLVKGYIHSQKAIGKDKIVMPDKHATRDDYLDVFRKLGNPEKLEDFKVNSSQEVDAKFLDGFREAAHKAGLLPWQAEEVVNYVVGNAQEAVDANNTTTSANEEESIRMLKAEWGEAFEENVQRANIALDEFLPNKDDRDMIAGMTNNTALIKLLAGASKLMTEDQFVGHGSGQFGKMSPAEALQKARDIQGNSDGPYRDSTHLNHNEAKKEVADLYKIAYPE